MSELDIQEERWCRGKIPAFRPKGCRFELSDVKKELGCEAKTNYVSYKVMARAKYACHKSNAKVKYLGYKAKAKDIGRKAKAKAKDKNFNRNYRGFGFLEGETPNILWT